MPFILRTPIIFCVEAGEVARANAKLDTGILL